MIVPLLSRNINCLHFGTHLVINRSIPTTLQKMPWVTTATDTLLCCQMDVGRLVSAARRFAGAGIRVRSSRMGELYTMGYRAGWTPETLLMTMRESNAILCDIRFMPHSRWHPEWNQGSLAKQFGERYRHIKALGNRNYNNPGAPIDIVDIEEGIRQIETLLGRFSYVIAMCGCPQLDQCHRAIVAHEANYRLLVPIRELHPPQPDEPQLELFMR